MRDYALLAALNGAAVKCLIAMIWEQANMTISQLVPRVGHDKNTVRKALDQLQLYGLAAKIGASIETWVLTDRGYQLPLPLPTLKASGEILTPTTTDLSVCVNNEPGSSRSKKGEILTTTTTAESPEYTAALEALFRYNITMPKADEIARCHWATPEYIDLHVAQAKREHKKLGLAIVRMLAGQEPEPEAAEETTAESWRRFVEP